MHFSRKTILVVGAALLAACGDKVTVAEYTPPPVAAKVNSVEVAPAGATLTVGQSITLTAAVNADAGVATTVTWSASAANVTVSSAGVVQAVSATPGVAVCATSTVDTGKKGCATIVVQAPATTGLTVTPSSATLNIGDKIQLTGSVQGATAAITWTSMDATKATVSSTGLVTAVAATPGTAVCAAAAGFTTCATIAVNAVIVSGVSVTPSSATLFVGDELTLTAALNSSGSPATKGFTWSTSNASAVSVDNGKIKGLAATPGVAVCATSNDDPTKKGCATIVVNIVPVPQPASVSIASITTNVGGLNAPVNPSAVAGQIDVTLNVNPGQQTVKKVDLLIGGTVVATQTFTAAEAAALRYSADQAVAAQIAFPQVVLSYNTATANTTTGAPAYLNGTYDVKAQISVAGTGGTTTAAASANTSLTFANPNTVATSISFSGNTANDGAGYMYRSGNMTVNVIPVIYSGTATVTAVNISYNSDVPACDLGAGLARGGAGTAPAAGSYAWTATISGNATDAAAATNGSNFEYNSAGVGCNYASGGADIRVTVVGNNGNAIVNAALVGRARLDNRAPAAPTILVNAGGRSGNWLNGVVRFNETNANDAANGWLLANAADAGVGGKTVYAKIGADLTTAIASTSQIATAASLTPTADNVSQCIVLYGRDALGNTSASPDPTLGACGAGAVQPSALYGFDNTAPTVSFSGLGSTSAGTHRRSGATIGLNYTVNAVDNGAIGNSGMNATNPIWAFVKVRNTAGTTCVVADPATLLTTCAEANITNNAARIGALAAGSGPVIVAAETVNGYYTATARVMDAAGNFSAAATRVTMLDNVAPSVTTVSLTNAANNNTGFTFSALASDNLDLQNNRWAFAYAGATLAGFFDLDPLTAGVQAPLYWRETASRTTINGYNAATFLNSNVMLSGTVNLPLALQGTVAGAWPAATVGVYSAADKLNQIFSETRDQSSVTLTTPSTIGGSVTVPAAGWLNTGAAPTTDIQDFRFGMAFGSPVSYSTAGVAPSSQSQVFCSGAETRDSGVTGGCQVLQAGDPLPFTVLPSSIAVRVQVQGVTGSLIQPFSRVQIVTSNGVGATSAMINLTSLTTATLADNGTTRLWRWDGTVPMDASTFDTMGGTTPTFGGALAGVTRWLYAVGIDANGRIGFVSQPVQVQVKP